MDWKHLLASITGTVKQALLLRFESLVTQQHLLRHQITGRVRFTEGARLPLAVMGQKPGKKTLEEVANSVTPDTILAWHRQLVAQQFDGSQQRQAPGRLTVDPALEALVVRLAQEKRSGGSERMVGALANLGDTLRAQTVGHILKRPGLPPASARKTTTPWTACMRTPMAVLVAADFFTAEVWTQVGLVPYDVWFFLHLASRKVQVAGMPAHPEAPWRQQVARTLTRKEWGCLSPG
jgi:hypothetical protein